MQIHFRTASCEWLTLLVPEHLPVHIEQSRAVGDLALRWAILVGNERVLQDLFWCPRIDGLDLPNCLPKTPDSRTDYWTRSYDLRALVEQRAIGGAVVPGVDQGD